MRYWFASAGIGRLAMTGLVFQVVLLMAYSQLARSQQLPQGTFKGKIKGTIDAPPGWSKDIVIDGDAVLVVEGLDAQLTYGYKDSTSYGGAATIVFSGMAKLEGHEKSRAGFSDSYDVDLKGVDKTQTVIGGKAYASQPIHQDIPLTGKVSFSGIEYGSRVATYYGTIHMSQGKTDADLSFEVSGVADVSHPQGNPASRIPIYLSSSLFPWPSSPLLWPS